PKARIGANVGVDHRVKPTTVRFKVSSQPHGGTAEKYTTFDPPWPGLSRPPTSSPSAPSNGKKAWMAGTSPATGIPGCVGRATNNRTCSTGQPWHKAGQDEGC